MFIWINRNILGRRGRRWADQDSGSGEDKQQRRWGRRIGVFFLAVLVLTMLLTMMAGAPLLFFAGVLFHLPAIGDGLGLLTKIYCKPAIKKASELLSSGTGGVVKVLAAPLHAAGNAVRGLTKRLGDRLPGVLGDVVRGFGDSAGGVMDTVASPFDVAHMGLELARKFSDAICVLNDLQKQFEDLGLKDKMRQALLCSNWPERLGEPDRNWCIDDTEFDRAEEPPPWLLQVYQAAAEKYDVPWPLLAAINWNDTSFGQSPTWKAVDQVNRGSVGWIPLSRREWNSAKVDAGNVPPDFRGNPWKGDHCPDPEGVPLGGAGYNGGGAIITGTQPRTLTRGQVAALARAAGLPSIFVDIAQAESSFQTAAINSVPAVGLWQINVRPGVHDDLQRRFGDMKDPWNNARAAKVLLDSRLRSRPGSAEAALSDWSPSQNAGDGGGWGQHLTAAKAREVLATRPGIPRAPLPGAGGTGAGADNGPGSGPLGGLPPGGFAPAPRGANADPAQYHRGRSLGNFQSTTYGPPWNSQEGGRDVCCSDIKLDNGRGKTNLIYGIAIDPSVLRMGKYYYVWPNPFRYRGPFLAMDTGSAIKGKHIDIFEPRGAPWKDRWNKTSQIWEAVKGAGPAGAGGQRLTRGQLIGQHIQAPMYGDQPSQTLLDRVRRGRVGAVIVMGEHRSAARLKSGIQKLQAAAAEGGNPPLIVSVDQEGGAVQRLRWKEAQIPAPDSLNSPERARREAKALSAELRATGITLDLAPVLDVYHRGYLGGSAAQRQRSFGSDVGKVSELGEAWTEGIQHSKGVSAAVKHWPGLGRAQQNTDLQAVSIGASEAELQAEANPFRRSVSAGARAVMVSNASYSKLDGATPAVMSEQIVQQDLRKGMQFSGVVVSDELNTPGTQRAMRNPELPIKAGVDLLTLAGDRHLRDADQIFERLASALRAGRLSRAQLESGYQRLLALKMAGQDDTGSQDADAQQNTEWFVPDGHADPCDPVDSIFTLAHWLSQQGVSGAQWQDGLKAYQEEFGPLAGLDLGGSGGGGDGPIDLSGLPGSTGKLKWPLVGPISSPFGPRWGRLHAGIDIAVPAGTAIQAPADGVVGKVYTGRNGNILNGYGSYFCVQHTHKLATCYGHSQKVSVRQGQRVRTGQRMGESGGQPGATWSGDSGGEHLHFEVRTSEDFARTSAGGSFGAVDPMPYLGGKPAGSGPAGPLDAQRQGAQQQPEGSYDDLLPNRLGRRLLRANKNGSKPKLGLRLGRARQPSAASCGDEGVPDSVPGLSRAFKEAGNVFGLQPQLLQALTDRETRLGCRDGYGWTRIPDAVWAAFGVDANSDGASRYDSADAIFTTARYLRWLGKQTPEPNNIRLMLAGYHQQYGDTGKATVARYVSSVIKQAYSLGANTGPVIKAKDELIAQALQLRHHTLDPKLCEKQLDYVNCIAYLYGETLRKTGDQESQLGDQTIADGCLDLGSLEPTGDNPYAQGPKRSPVTSSPLGKSADVMQGPGGGGTHSFSAPPTNWQSDNAVDISTPRGTPVLAVDDGVITGPGPGPLPGHGYDPADRFAGARFTLKTRDNEWWYAHLLANFRVRRGQRVKAGQVLGFSGSANNVPHLHLAVLRDSPLRLLAGAGGCQGAKGAADNQAEGSGAKAAIRFAAGRQGRVAFAYIDPRGAVSGYHRQGGFNAQGTAQALMAGQYLRGYGERALPPDAPGRLEKLLTSSDERAANRVYRDIGGQDGLQELSREANIPGLGTSEDWALTQVTPDMMMGAFTRLDALTPRRYRNSLLSWTNGVVAGQDWGIPEGWNRAAWHFKGGWDNGRPGRIEQHQCGFTDLQVNRQRRRVALCVFTDRQPSVSYARETISRIAAILAKAEGGASGQGNSRYGPYGANANRGGNPTSFTLQGDSLSENKYYLKPYRRVMRGWKITSFDGVGARMLDVGMAKLRRQQLGDVVVFALGTNNVKGSPAWTGSWYRGRLKEALRIIGPRRCLVVPTIYYNGPVGKFNQEIRRLERELGSHRLHAAPWSEQVDAGKVKLGDGVHPYGDVEITKRVRIIGRAIRECR